MQITESQVRLIDGGFDEFQANNYCSSFEKIVDKRLISGPEASCTLGCADSEHLYI